MCAGNFSGLTCGLVEMAMKYAEVEKINEAIEAEKERLIQKLNKDLERALYYGDGSSGATGTMALDLGRTYRGDDMAALANVLRPYIPQDYECEFVIDFPADRVMLTMRTPEGQKLVMPLIERYELMDRRYDVAIARVRQYFGQSTVDSPTRPSPTANIMPVEWDQAEEWLRQRGRMTAPQPRSVFLSKEEQELALTYFPSMPKEVAFAEWARIKAKGLAQAPPTEKPEPVEEEAQPSIPSRDLIFD